MRKLRSSAVRNSSRWHRRRAARVYRRRRRTALFVVFSFLVAVAYALWPIPAVAPERVGGVDAPATADQPGLPSGREPDVRAPENKPPLDEGFDAGALEAELQRTAAEHLGIYGVVVSDPASGARASLNPEEAFEAASLAKLPVMLALYRAAATGEVDLEEEITLRASDVRPYGSGVLKDYPVGTKMTLRECAFYLMKESDNSAWIMLERYLGRPAVVAVLQRLGVENLAYGGYTYGYRTNPEDVVVMLKAVSDPGFTSPELSKEMLNAMTNTAYEDRLPALLPEDVRIAHKIGSYDHTFSDAGVVFFQNSSGSKRRYFIAVLGQYTTEAAARDAISEIALATHLAIADSP